jgi:hypothetical protein
MGVYHWKCWLSERNPFCALAQSRDDLARRLSSEIDTSANSRVRTSADLESTSIDEIPNRLGLAVS